MPLFANSICSRVADGAVVETGKFAALIAPTSALSGGFPDAAAKARWGIYPHSAHTATATHKVEAASPWYDANDDAVYETQLVEKAFADLKLAKIAAVKSIGPTRVAEGFKYTVPGGAQHTYQVDLESQSHMMAVFAEHLDGVENPHGGYWRSRENVNVDMTDAENKAFLRAAKAYKMAIIRRAQVLIDAAVAAEDAAALALIDAAAGTIDGAGGWPENNG